MKALRAPWLAAIVAGSTALAVPLSLFAQDQQPAAEHAAGETAHEGATHEEAHEESGPSPINWFEFGHNEPAHHGEAPKPQPPFLATVINFLLLFTLLYWATKRAINPFLADRRAAMQAEIGEAQRLRSEAEALHREYTERLAKMDAEFSELKSEFVRLGEQEYKRIVDEAKARAERMEREGEFAIQQEIKQLRSDLTREAVDAAIASAESAVKKAVTPADHTRLADAYVAELEKNRGAAA